MSLTSSILRGGAQVHILVLKVCTEKFFCLNRQSFHSLCGSIPPNVSLPLASIRWVPTLSYSHPKSSSFSHLFTTWYLWVPLQHPLCLFLLLRILKQSSLSLSFPELSLFQTGEGRHLRDDCPVPQGASNPLRFRLW